MPLFNCPECGKQISDKAQHFVSCGFRINVTSQHSNYQSNYSITQIENESHKKEWERSSTIPFVLGLLSLIAWHIPLIGFPISIAGIISAAVSLSRVNNGDTISGLVLSILGLTATFIDFFIGTLNWSQYFSNLFD